MTDLKELERLAGECSPLPWFDGKAEDAYCVAYCGTSAVYTMSGRVKQHPQGAAVDAAYIAAACNALPALLELVREQHEALEEIVDEWPTFHASSRISAALAKYNDMMEKGDD